MREMRSSIIFLGSLVTRCKEALICPPGGCDIGVRPIDLHLNSLRKLGAQITETGVVSIAVLKNCTVQKYFLLSQA